MKCSKLGNGQCIINYAVCRDAPTGTFAVGMPRQALSRNLHRFNFGVRCPRFGSAPSQPTVGGSFRGCCGANVYVAFRCPSFLLYLCNAPPCRGDNFRNAKRCGRPLVGIAMVVICTKVRGCTNSCIC